MEANVETNGENGVVDPVYFKQHPTLKLYPVDKITFNAQRLIYETKYTRDYMEAKTLEISRRMSLDEDERLGEKLDNISEVTMATFTNTVSTGSKSKSSNLLKVELSNLKDTMSKQTETHKKDSEAYERERRTKGKEMRTKKKETRTKNSWTS